MRIPDPSRWCLPLLALTATACRRVVPPPPPPQKVLLHDYGVIPHGQIAEHVFEIPVPTDARYLALRYEKTCTCGIATFLITGLDGKTRETPGLPWNRRIIGPGERLQMRLVVDTRVKEAVDQPQVTINGNVLLQDAAQRDRLLRIPVTFLYAIDAPLRVSPVAHIDFGELPRSGSYTQALELHCDRPVRFGPTRSSDPRLRARLERAKGVTLLRITFKGRRDQEIGAVRGIVEVATDLPDHYLLRIPVSGQIIPDVVVEPMNHIGFNRIPFDRPAERFVNVVDHDLSAEPKLRVLDVRDQDEAPLGEHFAVRLEPIPGAPRTTRLFLRYLGNMTGRSFRGVIRLARKGQSQPVTRIDFVGFRK